MTWPLEMSRIINEYVGPFRFWDDADRDMILSRERRVIDHVKELRTTWEDFIVDRQREDQKERAEQRRDILDSMDAPSESDYNDDDFDEAFERRRIARFPRCIKPDSLIGDDDTMPGFRLIRTEAEWVEMRAQESRACNTRRAAYFESNSDELARQFAEMNTWP